MCKLFKLYQNLIIIILTAPLFWFQKEKKVKLWRSTREVALIYFENFNEKQISLISIKAEDKTEKMEIV